MKMKVEAAKEIDDGRHDGKIIDIEYRENPYQYTEIVIEETSRGMKLKAGYPTYLSPVSKLGKMMLRFGVNLQIGQEIDPDVLVGKECSFVVVNKTTQTGTFPTIVVESLVPKENNQ